MSFKIFTHALKYFAESQTATRKPRASLLLSSHTSDHNEAAFCPEVVTKCCRHQRITEV